MVSLLYVSRSKLNERQADAVVAAIVIGSDIKNLARGMTGAVTFSGVHFAQALEAQGG
jgi:Sensors of blue-light using FAD